MPEVLTANPEPAQQSAGMPETARAGRQVRSSSFKYYIHDSVSTLRFQLIGDLRTWDVTELSGSWETAQTTLGRRSLVLDVRQLHSTDDEGDRWLLKMTKAGATALPAGYFESGANPVSPRVPEDATCHKLSLVAKLFAILRGTTTAFRPEP